MFERRGGDQLGRASERSNLSPGTCAPWASAVGTSEATSLRTGLRVCDYLHLPLTLHYFLLPTALCSGCHGLNLPSAFSYIHLFLITIPKEEKRDRGTSQLAPWGKSGEKRTEGIFKVFLHQASACSYIQMQE